MKKLLIAISVLISCAASGQHFYPQALWQDFTGHTRFTGPMRLSDTLAGADSGSLAYKNGTVYVKSSIWTPLGAGTIKQIFFATVAALRAYSGTTDVQATTQGYYAANDGGGASYYWDGSSTAADDGGLIIKPTSITTGRWRMLYGTRVYLRQFGAKADSTTDARPAFKLAMKALNSIPLSVDGRAYGQGTLVVNRGKYFFADSIQIRQTINIEGEGAGTYPYQETQVVFSGIHGGFYFLMTSLGYGGRNCRIANIFLKSQITNFHQTWHGIFSNATITIDNANCYSFSGDGIIIDTRDSGNANNCYIRAHCDYNRRYGLSMWGNDANNCEIYFDGSANGGSNIHDQSFLGNHYKWVHSSFAGIRQPDNLSYVNVSGTIYGAIQPSINIQPGVTSGWQDYWRQQNNLPLGWTTTWRSDSTYIDACAISVVGSANATTLDAPYTESGQLPVYIPGYSVILNGNQNGAGITDRQVQLTNNGGILRATGGLMVNDFSDPNAYVLFDDGNGLNIGYTGIGAVQLKAFSSFGDTSVRIYWNSSLQPTLSFPLKALKGHADYRVDTVYPGTPVFGHRGFWMSDNAEPNYTASKKNLILSGHAIPTSPYMVYPQGAFLIYDGPSIDTIGARCTVGGRGGTATWVWIRSTAASVFTALTDAPASYSGQANKVVTVNGSETGLIFSTPSGGSAWGLTGNSITPWQQYIGTTNNASLRFRTNGTEKVILDSIGIFGVALTTAPGFISSYGDMRFQIESNFGIMSGGSLRAYTNNYNGDLSWNMRNASFATNVVLNTNGDSYFNGGKLGAGTASPNSSLHTPGSFAVGYVAKTANYTLTVNDHTVNCTANSFTITLPTAVGIDGRIYIVKNTGAGTITLATTSSQTIDGSAPGTVAAGAVVQLQSTGANWIKIN